MAIVKGRLKQKTSEGSDTLHPETEADAVLYSGTVGSTSVTTVKGALDTIISAGVGVTDVQNGSGTSLVDGSVATVTPANIGAVVANSNSLTGATKTKITYDSKGLVTAGDDLAVSDLPDNIPTSKITGLGAAAFKGVTTSTDGIWPSSTDDTLVTAKAVCKAIDALPDPMEFMGTLGTNGSVTALQPPAAVKKGWTYKVIEDGEYSYAKSGGTGKVIAEEGDVVINNGTDWVLIPSGDDVEDTWRGIKVNGTSKLGNGINSGDVDFVNGGNITVSFNSTGNKITLGVAANHSIPSDDDQAAWSGKQDALAPQTAYSAKGTTTKVPQITTNSLGQVTLIEEKSIAFPDIPDIVFKNVQENDVLTQQECDDFAAHKLALVFPQASFPCFYLNTNDNLGYLEGSVIIQSSIQYNQSNNFTGEIGYCAYVNSSTRKVGLQTLTSSSFFYTSTPTSGSNQLFTAGGAYTELAKKADKANITAGIYSAVAVNSQGIVTAGYQALKVVANGGSTTDVVEGGWYFEKDAE